jgi:glycosyltransferase involved in cell wall biosynthesis
MPDHENVPHLAVSAIIPVYNRAHLIGRAIDSVLATLGSGDELIVVDDGSTDGTVATVEAYGDRVRLLKEPHGGAGPARNAGVAAARNPLIAFLDSDDEWFPDKIALQRPIFERRPDVLFCCSDFGVRLEDGTETHNYLPNWFFSPIDFGQEIGAPIRYSQISELPAGRPDFDVHIGSIYAAEMRSNIVTAFTLMVRREAADDALSFATDLPTAEEWPAFARLAKAGSCAMLATETAWQHGHSSGRLTDQPMYVLGDAWLKTLERVWGQDEEFLATNGASYRTAVTDAHLIRARSLIRHLHFREGTRELKLAGGLPALGHLLMSQLG